MRCPECGKHYTDPTWYVRHLVGLHKYTQQQAVATLDTRNCYNCGKQMPNPDALGCVYCGAWHGNPRQETKQ